MCLRLVRYIGAQKIAGAKACRDIEINYLLRYIDGELKETLFLSTEERKLKQSEEIKMIKKSIALCMAAVLSLSALTACGNEAQESSESKQQSSETAVVSTATEATSEVVEEIAYPEEISIFAAMGASSTALGFKDFNDAYWAQALEEITGTHVEWSIPASGASTEKFNLMIASEEYTDAIVYNWPAVEGGPEMYLEDEVIVDLTELIPECMPNLNAYLEEHPEIKKTMQNEAGQILYIPFIRDDVALNIFVGTLIRTDWVEKLGLEIPKTTDDLYTVLKAFKEKDPNGNGQADEIPMSGVGFKENPFGIGSLLWAFDTHFSFYVEDGKVVWGPMEERFTEGLGYIAKLYDEDLIDIDYLLNDRTAMDSKALADRVGFLFTYQPTKYYNNKEFNNGTNVMMGIPYLTTADNDSLMCFNSAYTQSVMGAASLAVTTACEDPKALLKWLDTVYSEEGIILMNYGEEGTHFEYVDGKPYVDYSVLTADEQREIKANTMVLDTAFPSLQQWDAVSSTYSPWGGESISIWAEDVDISGILPTLSFTSEEKEQIANKLTELETYADTEMNNVVIGKLSIEEWPKIVEKFKEMGIEEILEVYNTAYQRYLAK